MEIIIIDVNEYRRLHALTAVYVTHRLGKRPRRIADQDEAIRRASDALDADDSVEGQTARRILAIEYTAWSELAGALGSERRSHRPTPAEWVQAVDTVRSTTDEDTRRRARGGMVVRAAQGGWVR